jgi:hypothetical protein
MTHIGRTLLFGIFILGCFASERVLAQIQTVLTVNSTGDAATPIACNNGTAGCTLRGAIQVANAGEAIIAFNIPASDPNCSAGFCTIRINSDLPPLTGPNITIAGPGADRLMIGRTAGFAPRAFLVNNASGTRITIAGLRIENFTNDASAITKSGAGTLDVIDTYLALNHSPNGGAIAVLAGTVNVVRSTLFNNTADGDGGGIVVRLGGVCFVTNSTIAQNDSDGGVGGGGILVQGTATISNSTILDNAANSDSGSGGGIYNSGGLVNAKSTIIARNFANFSGHDVFGSFASAGFNLIGKKDGSGGFTSATDLTGTNAAPLDARFDPNGIQLFGGSTPTRALLPDSPAIDKGSSAALVTGVLATDQRFTGFKRTRDNPLVPNVAGGDGTDIGAYERHTYSTFDFEGDGRTDVGIFRPSGGEWWITRSLPGATRALQFGASTDRIAPADFTGDGITDVAFWRPSDGNWYVLRSENFSFFAFGFGTNGDVPAPGDFDGDRKADAAVFRPSTGTWFVLKSTGGLRIEQFGINGDIPVVSDYDGDGRGDIAIYRQSNGQWWLNRSTAGVIAFTFGSSTDKVVPGDFTGDNKADVAFWRPSTGEWYVLRSENSTFFAFAFGSNGDMPAPGDYDGDGKIDATVFRPSSATWFSQRSNGGFVIQQFGLNGDRPIAGAFIP